MLHKDRFYDQPKAVKKQVLKPVWVDPSGANGLTTDTRNGKMLHTGRFYDQPTEVKKQVLKPAWVGTLRGLTV